MLKTLSSVASRLLVNEFSSSLFTRFNCKSAFTITLFLVHCNNRFSSAIWFDNVLARLNFHFYLLSMCYKLYSINVIILLHSIVFG